MREETARERSARADGEQADLSHAEVQIWLRDLGHALGYEVWIASNDQSRVIGGARLGHGCLESLPAGLVAGPSAETIRFIDVLWLERGGERVVAAFEVEHTTSIYSGIMRMLDLASTQAGHFPRLYLVAPDGREDDVRRQLARPVFSRISS